MPKLPKIARIDRLFSHLPKILAATKKKQIKAVDKMWWHHKPAKWWKMINGTSDFVVCVINEIYRSLFAFLQDFQPILSCFLAFLLVYLNKWFTLLLGYEISYWDVEILRYWDIDTLIQWTQYSTDLRILHNHSQLAKRVTKYPDIHFLIDSIPLLTQIYGFYFRRRFSTALKDENGKIDLCAKLRGFYVYLKN